MYVHGVIGAMGVWPVNGPLGYNNRVRSLMDGLITRCMDGWRAAVAYGGTHTRPMPTTSPGHQSISTLPLHARWRLYCNPPDCGRDSFAWRVCVAVVLSLRS